jgi:hypothetical protein
MERKHCVVVLGRELCGLEDADTLCEGSGTPSMNRQRMNRDVTQWGYLTRLDASLHFLSLYRVITNDVSDYYH